MINRNKPSVMIVTGNVKTTNSGLTSAFMTPSIIAVITAMYNPDISTPGNISAVTSRANAPSAILAIIFIIKDYIVNRKIC